MTRSRPSRNESFALILDSPEMNDHGAIVHEGNSLADEYVEDEYNTDDDEPAETTRSHKKRLASRFSRLSLKTPSTKASFYSAREEVRHIPSFRKWTARDRERSRSSLEDPRFNRSFIKSLPEVPSFMKNSEHLVQLNPTETELHRVTCQFSSEKIEIQYRKHLNSLPGPLRSNTLWMLFLAAQISIITPVLHQSMAAYLTVPVTLAVGLFMFLGHEWLSNTLVNYQTAGWVLSGLVFLEVCWTLSGSAYQGCDPANSDASACAQAYENLIGTIHSYELLSILSHLQLLVVVVFDLDFSKTLLQLSGLTNALFVVLSVLLSPSILGAFALSLRMLAQSALLLRWRWKHERVQRHQWLHLVYKQHEVDNEVQEIEKLRSRMVSDIYERSRASHVKSRIEQAVQSLKEAKDDITLSPRIREQLVTVIDRLSTSDPDSMWIPDFQPLLDLHDQYPPIEKNTVAFIKGLAEGSRIIREKREEEMNTKNLSSYSSLASIASDLLEQPGLIVKGIGTWDFDIFAFAETTRRPLLNLGRIIFSLYEGFGVLPIDKDIVTKFFIKVEDGYRDNPYHNSLHGADVLHSLHYLIQVGGLESAVESLEIFGALFAAAIHDVNHPGIGNRYLINSQSPDALLYNDISVLENMHISWTFQMMRDNGLNVFRDLPLTEFQYVRKLIVTLVLDTDLTHHFESIAKFRSRLDSSTGFQPKTSAEDRIKLLGMFLKWADIAHPAKSWHLHRKWTHLIQEEFFRQGELEREANLPISPYCDRDNCDIPKAQIGFVDFIVQPVFDMLSVFFGESSCFSEDCSSHLRANRERWQQIISKEIEDDYSTSDSNNTHELDSSHRPSL